MDEDEGILAGNIHIQIQFPLRRNTHSVVILMYTGNNGYQL